MFFLPYELFLLIILHPKHTLHTNFTAACLPIHARRSPLAALRSHVSNPRSHTILDWKALGWDFENATSCHDLADPPQAPQKLWTTPTKFVFDGTTCCICFNAFGPEGGFIVGTCEHMYHPICLIAHMVIQRRCCQCKAPFHERLYELFGLYPYMPPSWEHNPENTPGMPSKWG